MRRKVQAAALDSKDPVTLEVRFEKLENTATHPATAVLHAPAKNLTVTVQNTGYHKTSS